jgi:hypothetical protein
MRPLVAIATPRRDLQLAYRRRPRLAEIGFLETRGDAPSSARLATRAMHAVYLILRVNASAGGFHGE